MKIWIARDKDSTLWLFNTKPYCKYNFCWNTRCDEHLQLNKELFPEVTFENSPQEVKIELVNGKER